MRGLFIVPSLTLRNIVVTQDLHNTVNNPTHYLSHPSGIECLEFTKHMNFFLGNAFKYIFRRNFKDSHDKDILKAHFYIKESIKYNNATVVYHDSDMWSKIDKVRDSEEEPYGDILFSIWRANCSPKAKLHLDHVKRVLEKELQKYGLL